MKASDMERKRFGGLNPRMSDEMMMSGQPQEMEMMVADAEQSDEDIFASIAPQGDFSVKALNNLVKATNRLLPLFGQEPTYPEFGEDVEVFPTDFVRVLAMFQGAINTAVDAEMIAEDMDFLMEEIRDDRDITMVASRLNSLAQAKDFKNFLKNPPLEEMEEEEEELAQQEENNMTEADIDLMFMERV
jgi:hypothetical protein